MENENDDRILVQVQTRPLTSADVRRIVIREVSKILTFYLHNNIINHGQFDEIKFRASQRLINLYVTNKPTILNTVKDYIIQVLRRDGIRPLIYKREHLI